MPYTVRSYYTGVILIFLSAFGFGLMPIFALYAYQEGVNVPTLLFVRFSLASVCMFACILLRRVRWTVSPPQMLHLFLLGAVLYTLQSTFYFSAVRYIPASLAALILYLYPVFVALLAVIVDKERLSGKMLAPAVLALLGITIVLGTPLSEIDYTGAVLAFGAALVYSLYIILGRRVVAQVPPLLTSAFIAAFAALSFLTFGALNHSLDFSFTPQAWLILLGVVLFSTILAMATFFAGMHIIGPTRASILSTVEPLITIGFSAFLLQESLSWFQGVGAGFVLMGAVWVIGQRIEGKKEQEG